MEQVGLDSPHFRLLDTSGRQGLPSIMPTGVAPSLLFWRENAASSATPLIAAELEHKKDDMLQEVIMLEGQLNECQAAAYFRILAALFSDDNNDARCLFFLNRPGDLVNLGPDLGLIEFDIFDTPAEPICNVIHPCCTGHC